MSASNSTTPPADDGPQEPQEPKTWRDALPFLIALGVAITALGAIGLSHLLRPAEERVTDDVLVQYVVNDFYKSRNSLNYELFRDTQCAARVAAKDFPNAAQFAEANRGDRDRDGKLLIPTMSVEVTGDRAAVTVNERREGGSEETTKTDLIVVKEGGDWKVCGA